MGGSLGWLNVTAYVYAYICVRIYAGTYPLLVRLYKRKCIHTETRIKQDGAGLGMASFAEGVLKRRVRQSKRQCKNNVTLIICTYVHVEKVDMSTMVHLRVLIWSR